MHALKAPSRFTRREVVHPRTRRVLAVSVIPSFSEPTSTVYHYCWTGTPGLRSCSEAGEIFSASVRNTALKKAMNFVVVDWMIG